MEELESGQEEERGGQMSFLGHLDELRKRLVNCVIIIIIAFMVCWYFADEIYSFLSVPIREALSEAARQHVPITGVTGAEKLLPLDQLKEGDTGNYIFDQSTNLGSTLVPAGTTVAARVARDQAGNLGLFTAETLITNNAIVAEGVRLPVKFEEHAVSEPNADERLIVTTAPEQFTLYITVSLYSAIALSIPFLLWQIWGFISPALYKHERAYVTPFIALSSISFVAGAAFAYYILFPPAMSYLLGLGAGEFQLLLRATDYLDFIMIIMLAMGIIFQMPAITYVLSRIGIISAGFLIRSWKISLIIILIIAALVSPTADVLNMMLFATPMMALYVVSIFIAWLFGEKCQTDAEANMQP